MEITERVFNALAISAFRYALGRATYIVQDHVDTFIHFKRHLDVNTVTIMLREIDRANELDALGMDMDKEKWLQLREVLLDFARK